MATYERTVLEAEVGAVRATRDENTGEVTLTFKGRELNVTYFDLTNLRDALERVL